MTGGIGDLVGSSDPALLNTTEILRPGGTFEQGPDLPFPLYSHCMATINDTHLFLTGGHKYERGGISYNRNNYIYSSLTQTWTLFSEDGKLEEIKNLWNMNRKLYDMFLQGSIRDTRHAN